MEKNVSDKINNLFLDTPKYRSRLIKIILKNSGLTSIISQNNEITEETSTSGDSNDTRKALNKKTIDFEEVMRKMHCDLEYIKSGTTGHTFKGTIYKNVIIGDNKYGIPINCAIKVVAYPNRKFYGNIYNLKRPENAELNMLKLLSEFVIENKTQHLVLPIAMFDTSIKPFLTFIEKGIVNNKRIKKYQEFIDRCNKGEYHNIVSVLISEWANKGDFSDFIKENYESFTLLTWKVLFFQIIFTLAIIQKKYPGFRHNDMKANNILIHSIPHEPSVITYKYENVIFKVPNIGYAIRIWDFDFACIPKFVENVKTEMSWTKDINVKRIRHKYYDIHYFFNTLYRDGFFPNFFIVSTVPNEVKEFVRRVIPEKYRNNKEFVYEKGRLKTPEEYTTPEEIILSDDFFNEFIVQTNYDISNSDKIKMRLKMEISKIQLSDIFE